VGRRLASGSQGTDDQEEHSMEGDVVSVERIIPAGPAAIFALVADASRHPEIDGSGTVRQIKPGAPQKLSLGATFGMSMKAGIGYSMESTVIEFEENRRIAWKATVAGPLGRFVGGRIWRYELEPVDGGTRVRESWDISEDHQRIFLRHDKVAGATRENITRSLARIETLTAPSA
jgi:uncharacterized protein YndB with AHSA1/START domain